MYFRTWHKLWWHQTTKCAQSYGEWRCRESLVILIWGFSMQELFKKDDHRRLTLEMSKSNKWNIRNSSLCVRNLELSFQFIHTYFVSNHSIWWLQFNALRSKSKCERHEFRSQWNLSCMNFQYHILFCIFYMRSKLNDADDDETECEWLFSWWKYTDSGWKYTLPSSLTTYVCMYV